MQFSNNLCELLLYLNNTFIIVVNQIGIQTYSIYFVILITSYTRVIQSVWEYYTLYCNTFYLCILKSRLQCIMYYINLVISSI